MDMKRLFVLLWFIYLVFLCCIYNGCQNITPGYLWTENASYNPDSLLVKTIESLDTVSGIQNPAVEEMVLSVGLSLDFFYSMGFTFEDIAKSFNLEPYVGQGEDYVRVKWGAPWVSTPIEGFEGTAPIYVSIKEIKPLDGGDALALSSVLTVRGNGTFEIPLYHDVPVGRYVISLNFRNEGYSKDVDDCFTIIVK